MLDAEEISGLKRARQRLEQGIAAFGETEGSAALMLAQRLRDLLDEIDATLVKSKSLWNPALETRIRFAKKGMKLSKGVLGFEKEVATEFEKGRLSENMGRRLISVIRFVKTGEMDKARDESGYFDKFIALNKEYSAADEKLKEEGRVLRREEHRVQNMLDELIWLDSQSIDETKVSRHKELIDAVTLLGKARDEHIASLLRKPVSELLDAVEAHPLKERLPQMPESNSLKAYLLQNPRIAKSSIDELCALFGMNDKGLSHICDVVGFKKTILANRGFFEEIRSLKQAKFLAVDVDDDAVLDFYASGAEGARDAVGRIRALRQDRHSDEAEYQKSESLEKKRAELSKYTKNGLDGELESIRRLLALLESEAEEKSGGGLLNALGALFSRK